MSTSSANQYEAGIERRCRQLDAEWDRRDRESDARRARENRLLARAGLLGGVLGTIALLLIWPLLPVAAHLLGFGLGLIAGLGGYVAGYSLALSWIRREDRTRP